MAKRVPIIIAGEAFATKKAVAAQARSILWGTPLGTTLMSTPAGLPAGGAAHARGALR